MHNSKIKQIFDFSWDDYCSSFNPSDVQSKAAFAIMNCKTGNLGYNISICEDCGHKEIHTNSCRNRNCPNCQTIQKELWIDERRSEVIDAPYFHVVFTIPAQLNALVYANQRILYSLLHRCSSEVLLELLSDKKYLGATPGIIQVLHTWGQELNYHPHIHCIVSGGGLTTDGKLKKITHPKFLIPGKVLANKFRGKFLACLQKLSTNEKLNFSKSCAQLQNSYFWKEFRNRLYHKEWNVEVRETFNGFGNAIEYLGRYTHRIAITNARIQSVTKNQVTFWAKDYRTGQKKLVTLNKKEFIRRFMMHVLPSGFQKIRYYGYLNNRSRKKNLKKIFRLQGYQKFKSMYQNLDMEQLIEKVTGINIHTCHECGCQNFHYKGRIYQLE